MNFPFHCSVCKLKFLSLTYDKACFSGGGAGALSDVESVHGQAKELKLFGQAGATGVCCVLKLFVYFTMMIVGKSVVSSTMSIQPLYIYSIIRLCLSRRVCCQILNNCDSEF